MRFFGMDVHISVIEDFKAACPEVQVTEWCMSLASSIMGKQQATPLVINGKTWKHMTPRMIVEFQREYDPLLRTFDGFIVGFASNLVMLFEKYGKPIIMINAVRYDIPFCWSLDMQMRVEFHKCLYRLHNAKKLWMVSNNRCDQSYTAKGLGLMPRYIPTLGTYAGHKYNPSKPTFYCYSEKSREDHPLITYRKPNRGIPWTEFGTYRGIIHFPYDATPTMSMFEQFAGGLPLFFPSRTFWLKEPHIWNTSQYWTKHPQNLEEFDRPDHWIELTCLYDVFKSPNTHIFDSTEHLYELLANFVYVPEDRTARNNAIKKQWADLLAELPRDKTVQTRYGHNPLS
jgi:hypothetical protein